MLVFWVVMPCGLVDTYRCFRETTVLPPRRPHLHYHVNLIYHSSTSKDYTAEVVTNVYLWSSGLSCVVCSVFSNISAKIAVSIFRVNVFEVIWKSLYRSGSGRWRLGMNRRVRCCSRGSNHMLQKNRWWKPSTFYMVYTWKSKLHIKLHPWKLMGKKLMGYTA